MQSLSSASLAASYGPSGSSSASMVSALAFLIPVLALGLMLAASPQVRAQLTRFRQECREYLYGPEKKPQKKKGTSPTAAATSADEPAPAGAASDTASKPEILSFDHSIFDEDEDYQ